MFFFQRSLTFLGVQAAIAAILYGIGSSSPWLASAAWWPVMAIMTNIVSIVFLSWLLKKKGRSYRQLFQIDRANLKSDLWVSFGILLVCIPLALVPNLVLAKWLFGDMQGGSTLLIHSLPLWVAVLSLVIFPVTTAMAELPGYFGYCMPTLIGMTKKPWLGVTIQSTMLAGQHMFLPFLWDGRFILWRFLMFLPLAFLFGIVLYRRPRLMPYMVAIHCLLDLAAVVMVLQVSL